MTENREGGSMKNHGWTVVFAGVGINLVLGVLYSWSVVSKKIPADWNWTEADRKRGTPLHKAATAGPFGQLKS